MMLAAAFIRTLLLYVLLGPLAGLLSFALPAYGILVGQVAWANIRFYWLHSLQCSPFAGGDCLDLDPSALLLPHAISLKMLLLGSYAIGCVPALFAGLLVAQAMLIVGSAVRFWHVLALGCLVGVIFSAMMGSGRYLHDARFFEGCAFLVYVCTIATIACWPPVRHWWPPSESAAARQT